MIGFSDGNFLKKGLGRRTVPSFAACGLFAREEK
jgi:hypothetical protein